MTDSQSPTKTLTNILLVEDNPADIRLTQEAFKEANQNTILHVVRDGAEALELLVIYAFEFLKLKQLYAHVPVTNAVSKSLFAKLQFVHTGTLKSWLRQGDEFIDVEVLQRVQ